MNECELKKICHMTSAHPTDDVRVFHKECVSLATKGYEVYLVGEGDSYENRGVHIIGVGEIPQKRLKRMFQGARSVYRKALDLDCDLYHFHDPELLSYGLKLKKKGKIVIFDSHEDVPRQILQKTYIPSIFRKVIAFFYKAYESYIVKRIDGVVAATPFIAKQFESRAKKVVDVNNYPIIDEIKGSGIPFANRSRVICYAGGINDLRGECIMCEAMKKVDGTLILAGNHEITEIRNEKSIIKYVGYMDRQKINDLYGHSIVGLCILKPVPNYVNSQPIKMYEYMAAGIPFICSDFPLWKEVVSKTHAGVFVSPDNIDEISEKILYFLDNPSVAEEMGNNGKKMVREHFSWANEEKTLFKFYDSMIGSNRK